MPIALLARLGSSKSSVTGLLMILRKTWLHVSFLRELTVVRVLVIGISGLLLVIVGFLVMALEVTLLAISALIIIVALVLSELVSL